MDKIKNAYQNWVRDEIENPDVQKAKEAFLRKHFEKVPAGPSIRGIFSPAFKLTLVGCCALAILVKIGAFQETPPLPQAVTVRPMSIAAIPASSVSENKIQINKLSSDMGATVAYQKHFPDVQVTVLWVFPKGA